MKRLLSIYVIMFVFGCKSRETPSDASEGTVLWKMEVTNAAGRVTTFTIQMWFRDSCIIQEIQTTHIDEDTGGHITITKIVDHYNYIDLKAQRCMYFRSFSDSAMPIENYKGADSVNPKNWSFHPKPLEYFGTPRRLGDTLIGGITYQRQVFQTIKDQNRYVTTAFFRCDKKNSLFRLHAPYHHPDECSMVKMEDVPLEPKTPKFFSEIIFLGNSLTEQEKRVFEKWKSLY